MWASGSDTCGRTHKLTDAGVHIALYCRGRRPCTTARVALMPQHVGQERQEIPPCSLGFLSNLVRPLNVRHRKNRAATVVCMSAPGLFDAFAMSLD